MMEKHKQDGNKLFTQKRYFEALDAYNKGLQTVEATIVDYLKHRTRDLLNNSRPSSALLCSVALNRLFPDDLDALLLYAECLVHFDDLVENALIVCLKALVDDKENQDALRVLRTCCERDARRRCQKNAQAEGDEDNCVTDVKGDVVADVEAKVQRTKQENISADAKSFDKNLENAASTASSTSAPTSASASSASSACSAIINDSESPLTRVWGTHIPLTNCLEDLGSIASSLPDSNGSGAVIGTILANAAASELALRQSHLATASAAAALVFLTNNAIKTKAAFRLTSALIMSCSFSQATESLSLLSALQIDAKDVTRLRDSLALRQRESRHGDFDWESHIRWTKENPGQDLDCASFVGPLEIAEIPLKGCGLKATRDVKQGEVLMVDHAYNACHRSNITHLMKGIFECVAGTRLKQYEVSKTLFFLTDGLNPRDLRPSSPYHVLSFPRYPLPFLPHQMIQLQHDESLDDILAAATATTAPEGVEAVMRKLPELIKRSTGGVPTNPSQFKTNEEKMKFGEKLVGIVNTNMMHHAQASCPWHILESQEETALSQYSTDGLWVLPSFLNTGSKTNVIAICLADVLVCKAARDIRKGEELLINYTIERKWSKREEFMDHHGIPMPPDPESPLKGKVEQIKKVDSKLEEIADLMRQNCHSEALKALNSLEKKNKDLITQDLIYSDLLFKKAKCQSLTGKSPSQVLPFLLYALEAERKFRPYGSDYVCLVLQWLRFPNLKTDEKNNLNILLDDFCLYTYGVLHRSIAPLLDSPWN